MKQLEVADAHGMSGDAADEPASSLGHVRSAAERVLLETIGWALAITGVAALVLPGPGLVMMFGGLTVLARYHEWAARWLLPLKVRALRTAAEGVASWLRIITSSLLAIGMIGCGALWIWGPPVPSWWPVGERWWLPGGVVVAVTQIASGLIALGLILYSYRRFRIRPEVESQVAYAEVPSDEAAA